MDNKNTSDLGGLNIPTGTDSGANPSIAASSAASEVIQGRTKRKYTKRNPDGSAAQPTSGVPNLSATQFAQLYSPELWGKVTTAPADTLAFATGSEVWKVSDKEKELLGASCSIAAQCFAVSDPRWLAVSLALITIIDVYGVRAAMYIAEQKKKAAEEKRSKA